METPLDQSKALGLELSSTSSRPSDSRREFCFSKFAPVHTLCEQGLRSKPCREPNKKPEAIAVCTFEGLGTQLNFESPERLSSRICLTAHRRHFARVARKTAKFAPVRALHEQGLRSKLCREPNKKPEAIAVYAFEGLKLSSTSSR